MTFPAIATMVDAILADLETEGATAADVAVIVASLTLLAVTGHFPSVESPRHEALTRSILAAVERSRAAVEGEA